MIIIPLIDLTTFSNGNTATRQAVVKQIYQACHEIGFMYLQNSGISKDLIEQVFTYRKYFFNLSNVFCSRKHRVMIPNDDRVKQSRYSIAFFCHPNDDTEIACLETCQKERPIYPPIFAGEYLLQRLQATYGNS